jgi:hypothetical protein
MALWIGHPYRVKTMGFLGKEYGIKWGSIYEKHEGFILEPIGATHKEHLAKHW